MRIHHGSLTANEVTTVVLDQAYAAVEVLNRSGNAEIYFTVDGPDPTIEGDDCYVLPAAMGSIEVRASAYTPVAIKLISMGSPTFTITAAVQ